jgi:hypothetical protein
MEGQRRQVVEEEQGGRRLVVGAKKHGIICHGRGLLSEQVDKRYKVGCGTKYERVESEGLTQIRLLDLPVICGR